MPHYYYIIVITVHNNFRNNFIQGLASFPPSNFIVLHSLFSPYSFFCGLSLVELVEWNSGDKASKIRFTDF